MRDWHLNSLFFCLAKANNLFYPLQSPFTRFHSCDIEVRLSNRFGGLPKGHINTGFPFLAIFASLVLALRDTYSFPNHLVVLAHDQTTDLSHTYVALTWLNLAKSNLGWLVVLLNRIDNVWNWRHLVCKDRFATSRLC